MAKSIVVVGSSNTDMIIRLPRIPRPGETLLGGQFVTAAGGKGANQAVGAARAGGAVTFIGRIGNDAIGEKALAGLRRDRINVRHIVRDPVSPSGVALIFVDAQGQNSIAVAGGANGRLSVSDIRRAAPVIKAAGFLLAQLETPLPTVTAAVQCAARARVPVILNPAPAQPLPARLLRAVSILTPNETEAELLTGIKVRTLKDASRACAKLRGFGVRTVIITLGSRGAYLSDAEHEMLIETFPVRALDTTAAGDIFNGALAVALTEGKVLAEAVRFANAAAALSVTRPGAQDSAPRRAAIERFLLRRR
jgi:ribokinase